ncbi:MAG: hypothetical protein NC930_06060 [Candidatus Omnitrophica bacterium]|nr:hypothetical protein [Candidatus Omnitrophota bacterium]
MIFKKMVFLLMPFIILILFQGSKGLYAQQTGQVSAQTQLKNIETRLAQIEADQKKVIETQEVILKKLDQLRIWVRRN